MKMFKRFFIIWEKNKKNKRSFGIIILILQTKKIKKDEIFSMY
jgi:hypothetical protein